MNTMITDAAMSRFIAALKNAGIDYDESDHESGIMGDTWHVSTEEIGSALAVLDRDENVAADTYWSLADMIEPHVAREGINPDGELPASVFESVQILLEHWVATRQTATVKQSLTAAPEAGNPVSVDDELVQEGLEYFARSGDAGDRKYVEAIRVALAAVRRADQHS